MITRTSGLSPVLLAALLALSSCSDSTGPIGPEAAAIAAALAQAGVLSGKAGGYASFAFAQVDETRPITLTTPDGGTAQFDAVGILLLYDARNTGGDFDLGWFNGVLAWNGLDVGAGSASQVNYIGAEGSGEQALLTGSVEIGEYVDGRGGLAQHYVSSGPTFYLGTAGTYTVSSAQFEASNRDCALPADAPAPPVTCRVARGTMRGTFTYTGTLASPAGDGTLSQPSVTFDLPAIRVTLTN